MKTFTYAQPSEIGSGYATRSMVDGQYANEKDFCANGKLAGVHAIPVHVIEAIAFNHGIEKQMELAGGDKFVAWRMEFNGQSLVELLAIGRYKAGEMEARKSAEKMIADVLGMASQRKSKIVDAAIRQASL